MYRYSRGGQVGVGTTIHYTLQPRLWYITLLYKRIVVGLPSKTWWWMKSVGATRVENNDVVTGWKSYVARRLMAWRRGDNTPQTLSDDHTGDRRFLSEERPPRPYIIHTIRMLKHAKIAMCQRVRRFPTAENQLRLVYVGSILYEPSLIHYYIIWYVLFNLFRMAFYTRINYLALTVPTTHIQ